MTGLKINLIIGKFDLLALAILTATLCFAIWVGAGELSVIAMAAVAAIAIVCLLLGRATLRTLRLSLPGSALFPAGILAGMAIVSVAMLAVCLGARTSAGTAFLLVCLVGFALLIPDPIWGSGQIRKKNPRESILTPIVAFFICAISVVWSWQAVRSVPRLRTEGVLHAWIDFFFHSTVIAQFGHFSALGGTSMFSYGARIPLYHWASYMLPAVLCTFSNTPALVVATTFWVLFGFITMAMGAWVLGAVLADWAGGLLAVTVILLAPSAAHYGFRNHFFDFAWLLQISAGLSFGIGLSLLVAALLIIALRTRNLVAAGTAGALTLAEATFKAHFLATLLPACVLFFVLQWKWARPRVKFIVLGVLVSAALILMLVAERITRAPHFFTGAHDVAKILALMLDMEPSAAPHLFPAIAASTPSAISSLVGIFLVLVEATGALLPLYFLAWAYSNKLRLSRPDDCFPLLLLGAYGLVIALFPTNTFTGDPTEYQHRNFVLVYAVLSVWCSYFAIVVAKHWWPRHWWSVLVGCACCLLPVPFVLQSTTETNSLKWTKTLATNSVPFGILESAQYLRRVASPRDVILTCDSEEEAPLVALSERRALLVVDPNYAKGLGYSDKSIANRKAVGHELQRAANYNEMQHIAHESGVNWYVAAPNCPLSGNLIKSAAICNHGYCIVHF